MTEKRYGAHRNFNGWALEELDHAEDGGTWSPRVVRELAREIRETKDLLDSTLKERWDTIEVWAVWTRGLAGVSEQESNYISDQEVRDLVDAKLAFVLSNIVDLNRKLDILLGRVINE